MGYWSEYAWKDAFNQAYFVEGVSTPAAPYETNVKLANVFEHLPSGKPGSFYEQVKQAGRVLTQPSFHMAFDDLFWNFPQAWFPPAAIHQYSAQHLWQRRQYFKDSSKWAHMQLRYTYPKIMQIINIPWFIRRWAWYVPWMQSPNKTVVLADFNIWHVEQRLAPFPFQVGLNKDYFSQTGIIEKP